jgi:hypothetical protein
MTKFGRISVRIKFHITHYTIKGTLALVVNLVQGQSSKAQTHVQEGGGGKLILIKNVACIGKKVNDFY